MKFGQVDIEYNFYYKLYHKKESLIKDIFYTNIIIDYITFINSLIKQFPHIHFIINGVNMPNVYDLQHYLKLTSGIQIPKTKYENLFNNHNLFNIKLKNKCEEKNIPYFDLTYETTSNGKLKPEFIGKDHHLAGGDSLNPHTHSIFIDKLLGIIPQ